MGYDQDRRATDYLADRMTELERKVDDMPAAFKAAMVSVMSDDKVISDFWQRGYKELSSHAGNGASQWVGKRILTMVVAAIVTAGLVYLVKAGYIK